MKHFFTIAQRLFAPIQHFKSLFWTVVFQALIHSTILIAGTHIIKTVIDTRSDHNTGYDVDTIIIALIVLILAYLTNLYLIQQKTLNKLGPVAFGTIIQDYMQQFFELDSNYTEKVGTGKLINSIEKGAEARFQCLLELAWPFMVKGGNILFSVIYIFWLDARYGAIMLAIIIVMLVIHVIMQNKANHGRRQRKNVHMEISKTLVRHIQSKNEILQAQKTKKEVSLYKGYTDTILQANTKVMRYKFYSDALSKTMIDGCKIIAIAMVGYGRLGGFLPVSTFVVLIMILGLLDSSLYTLSRLYINITGYFIPVEKLREVFDKAPRIHNYTSGQDFVYHKGNITLTDITFGYDETNIFANFDLSLSGGQKIALVGPSGSGKSTLVKLIAGYITPSQGVVEVDGYNIQEISLQSYYQHIGYLTQEPSVFDGTIRDNLTYALHQDVDPEHLAYCISRAHCDFVRDLPQGLDTEIGEKGIRLSGGQRQRLAIAKVFLKNPDIIILDEPTAALDSFSEEHITQAMNNLFEHRTVIIIAHRLQTVKQADDIIVLDQGRIQERGTHDQLIAQNGIYAQMLTLQSGF